MRDLLAVLWLCIPGLAFAQDECAAPGSQDLRESDYAWIATRIAQNETGGEDRFLTYWGAGEDFPSFGIGHFIWYPPNVDAPFDESFPPMFEFVRQFGTTPPPEWLLQLQPFDAPWSDKATFDEQLTAAPLSDLRSWLRATASTQARFIVCSFNQRWAEVELPGKRKQALQQVLDTLMSTAQGRFAVIDYYNFKGLGTNERERYAGEGWGLVQVLGDISASEDVCAVPDAGCWLQQFSTAAAARLRQRVELSPPERNELRWLPGWERRVGAYSADEAPRAAAGSSGFRVTPYVQDPQPDSIVLRWFSHDASPGRVEWWASSEDGSRAGASDIQSAVTQAVAAPELDYADGEPATRAFKTLPYRHEVHLEDLQPGQRYEYRVYQGNEHAGAYFQTPDPDAASLRFVVYADSETEPESHGKPAAWPGDAEPDRLYLVDQSTGYAANLDVIMRRAPDFIAIAGDLVESGGEQRDWDEFWRHNARLAATTPIVAAAGNHEYFAGPRVLGGYGEAAWAIAKYDSYFTSKSSEVADKRYFAFEYGPVSLIVIDANDGLPQQSRRDTNWILEGVAPPWTPGSEQYRWLEETLAAAQQSSAFTFVMFHTAPYASGVHNQPPGLKKGEDYLSGVPLRSLTPLFLRYGVDAVFNGHDEMYEHSIVAGREKTAAGRTQASQVHFFVAGIGGDGLRESFPKVRNAMKTFSADTHAPEQWADGVLLDGGRHYGHLEVNIERSDDGCWRAQIDPVYVFPVFKAPKVLEGFERRIYDDSTTLTSCRSGAGEESRGRQQ